MSCDLCGASDPSHLFESPKLDGPLVRCRRCGLICVGRREGDFTFAAADPGRSRALADRVAALGIVDHAVEDAEFPHRRAADRERVQRVRRHAPAGGTLLDVGAATGALLQAAAGSFAAVEGVEPDPITSEQARADGLRVVTGTLEDVVAPNGGFDAITMVHVIEHLDSPRRALERARELLAPGGAILIETPTVDCLWFKLAPRRWRQLIPDHYFFFSRATLTAMLSSAGLETIEHTKVGRRVTVRFAADRLRRAGLPFAGALGAAVQRLGVGGRTVRLNPGDIMSVVAVKARE